MESRKNDGRDGGDAVDAWQGVQHLDMPDLDIPNLGEITSTFEPVTDVAPPHADVPDPLSVRFCRIGHAWWC